MLKVKIYSDFACPFCYLGLELLNRLRNEGVELDAEWFPFELDPNAPLEGMDLFQVYPEEYVLKSLNLLSKLGEPYNIKYNNKNGKFNTRRAHLGGFFAKEKGRYEEYAKAMFKAYFEDSINIGNKEELNNVVGDMGLDVDEMNTAIDSGKYDQMLEEAYDKSIEYKIQSVPTFIINDSGRVTGVRDYNRFKEEFLQYS